jgi:hypothetical protein
VAFFWTTNMTNYGFVYLMANDAMPNIYKIGYTDRAPLRRCEELSSSTSIPLPFQLVCYTETSDPSEVESEFHKIFDKNRISIHREFFRFEYDFLVNEVFKEFSQWGENYTKCEYMDMLDFAYRTALKVSEVDNG